MKRLLLFLLATPLFGQALQAVLYSDLTANINAVNVKWIKGYPTYGITWDTSGNFTPYLDCSQSSGGTGPYTYALAITDGPNTPTVTSPTASVSTVTGIITTVMATKDYTATCTVTDSLSAHSTATIHIGALPMDANGVVQMANANAALAYGPQIALGKNPWGYMDERHLYTVIAQNYGSASTFFPWLTKGTGTVAYQLAGPSNTTLCANVLTTDTDICVADRTQIDFSSFPTRFYFTHSGVWEEVRICSKTDGGGTVTTAHVCYDGRASSAEWIGSKFSNPASAPIAASSGDPIQQFKIAGTSTLFLTDANRPLSPAGAGPMGLLYYNSGANTCTFTAGSTSVTCTGTAFTSTMVGMTVRVAATHGGGTAFTLARQMAAFTSATAFTLDRAYPSDADTGAFAVKILTSGTNGNNSFPGMYPVLEYLPTDGRAVGRRMIVGTGCETETDCYGQWELDPASCCDSPATSQTGQKYSTKANIGVCGAFSVNFYGNPHRTMHFRSGLQYALQQANIMDDNWPEDPEVDGHTCGSGLVWGGGGTASIIDKATNPSSTLGWPDLMNFGLNSAVDTSGCNDVDSRDSGWSFGVQALLYNFDPDGTRHTTYKNNLLSAFTRGTSTVDPVTGYAGCQQADHSWANSFVFNVNSTHYPVDVTNGSSTAVAHTGFTFDATATCNDVAHGSATVTHNNSTFNSSGLFFTPPDNVYGLIMTGTNGGQPFTQQIMANWVSSSEMDGVAQWVGDTGTVSFIEIAVDPNRGQLSTIAAGNTDPLTQYSWGCYYVDSTHVHLHKAWDQATNTTGNLLWQNATTFGGGVIGHFQQPYMLGILTHFMEWTKAATADFGTTPATLEAGVSQWIHDTGRESDTLAVSYSRIAGGGEPFAPLGVPGHRTSGQGVAIRTICACLWGDDIAHDVIPNARELNMEASIDIKAYFDAQGRSSAARTWGNQTYGAVWGDPAQTKATYYSDTSFSNTSQTNLSNGSLSAYKYPGFFFGPGGNSGQWPAVQFEAPIAASGSFLGPGIMIGPGVTVH